MRQWCVSIMLPMCADLDLEAIHSDRLSRESYSLAEMFLPAGRAHQH